VRFGSATSAGSLLSCVLGAVLAAVSSPRLKAQEAPATGLAPAAGATVTGLPYWANNGRWEFGAQLGYSTEYGLDRHEVSHIQLLIAQPQLGLIVHDFRNPLVQRCEIISEGILGGAVHPAAASLLGVSLLSRFDGKDHGHWVPFFDAGAGAQRTTLSDHVPEVNGHTQFSPQGGFGLQYFFRPQRALVFEWRTMHMSNADLVPPNMGFNSSMITIGFRWLRRPVQPAR